MFKLSAHVKLFLMGWTNVLIADQSRALTTTPKCHNIRISDRVCNMTFPGYVLSWNYIVTWYWHVIRVSIRTISWCIYQRYIHTSIRICRACVYMNHMYEKQIKMRGYTKYRSKCLYERQYGSPVRYCHSLMHSKDWISIRLSSFRFSHCIRPWIVRHRIA